MTCFDIFIAYPLSPWNASNTAFDERIRHLQKHYNVDAKNTFETQTTRYLRLSVCDEDAVGFLRDLPRPTYCLWIRSLYQETFVYGNYKATGKWVAPPKNSLLKRVYWTASSLEKWQPTFPALLKN